MHRVILSCDTTRNVQPSINRTATVISNEVSEDGPRLGARAVGKQAADGKGNFSLIILPTSAPQRAEDKLAGIDRISVNDEATMVRPDPGFASDLMNRTERLMGTDDHSAGG